MVDFGNDLSDKRSRFPLNWTLRQGGMQTDDEDSHQGKSTLP